jgi:hypothetical protein
MALAASLPLKWRSRVLRMAFRLASLIARITMRVDHDLKLYERVVPPFASSAFALRSGYEGLFTARFATIYLDKLGIKACRCDGDAEKEVKSVLRKFCEDLGRSESVREKVRLVEGLLKSLKDIGFIYASEVEGKNFVKVACEELVHGLILHGTSVHELVDIASWEERFLLMYILEIAHRTIGDTFPRSPELVWGGGLSDDRIEEVLRASRKFLEEDEDVKRRLVEAFEELYFKMFFKSIFYPTIILPFVEVPTWIVLAKLGLMNESEVEERIEDYMPIEQEEVAEYVYQHLRGLDVEEVISIVKKSLNAPLEDLKKCLIGGRAGEEVIRLSRLVLERLESVVEGRRVSVYKADKWGLLASLRIFKMRDLTKLFAEILSEEPEVMKCVAFQSARPRRLGVVLASNKCTILYDPWTMEKSDEIYGGIVVRRTGRRLTTTEDLIGSTPLVLRSYLMLRHYLSRGDQDSIAAIREIVGVDEDTWKGYIDGVGRFRFMNMTDKDVVLKMDPIYAIDSILGVMYTFAKLGERAKELAGLHGIYIV